MAELSTRYLKIAAAANVSLRPQKYYLNDVLIY